MVFGAGGQLGLVLSQRLTEKSNDHQVLAFSHRQADITNLEEIVALVSRHHPDQIVNTAAYTDVAGAEHQMDLANKVNIEGALNIAKAASHVGASVIQLSTDYVFDGGFSKPIDEDEKQCPINNYGRSKAGAEILLEKDFQNSVVILRTAWLYGPGGKNFARSIMTKAIKKPTEIISVVDDQWGQPTSTLDLAEKIIEIGENRISSGILHGTNSGLTNWFEFAQLLLSSAGLEPSLIKPIKTSEFATTVRRPVYSVLSHGGWIGTGIEPLRDWRLPVLELATIIRREVEIHSGI